MVFREIIAVYFENYNETTRLINVTVGGPWKLPLRFKELKAVAS
jgi:hypothetical protein